MNEACRMMQGTVSEFDPRCGVGLIDADDGEIVLFNTRNLEFTDAPLLDVGLRVQFIAHQDRYGPHADVVRICH